MSTSKITDLQAHVQAAWAKRKMEVQNRLWQAFRLIHGDGDGLPGLTLDYYAGVWHGVLQDTDSPYRRALPAILDNLGSELRQEAPVKIFWTQNTLKQRTDSGGATEAIKIIEENDLKFQVRLGSGLHTGLFLDQRDNRNRIRRLAMGKKVLNLFCYTGAFTIAALQGGAREVHSVDLSKNYLADLQENLRLNGLAGSRAPVYATDVFDFLKRARQKRERFDEIILDPPSFSRSKNLVFSTEKNLASLAEATLGLLNDNGKLFASINTQKLRPKDFQEQLKLAIGARRLKILENFSPPFDFPQEDPQNPHLKACLIGSI